MATRQTRKAGILKPRLQDQALQKTLDSIIERLEVMDGIRGDSLDKAVTFRELQDAGYDVSTGSFAGGGNTTITPPPGSGDGPGVGPTTKPTGLDVTETYLALFVSWNNPPLNLQHIEIWRNTTDDLSTATLIGTTPRTRYIDYVGANATYFYWVRAVATDGTYSAYAGVGDTTDGFEGTTGVDPSQILMDPDNFQLQDVAAGIIAPFLVGEINGVPAVGLQGEFIVDGSIRGTSIVAGTIGAGKISVDNLQALSANMGTLTTGLLRTDAGDPDDDPAGLGWRVEIEALNSTVYPIWYGTSSKSAANGLFYVTADGQVVIRGLLDTGMIRQSYFTPGDTSSSFRVACEYPNNYSGGVYTGRTAHLMPMRIMRDTFTDATFAYNSSGEATETYTSTTIAVYSPTYTGHEVSFGRLGSNRELLYARCTATGGGYAVYDQFAAGQATVTLRSMLQYQYDAEGWQDAFSYDLYVPFPDDAAPSDFVTGLEAPFSQSGTAQVEQVLVTRSTSFQILAFRIVVSATFPAQDASYPTPLNIELEGYIGDVSCRLMAPNFGVADVTTSPASGGDILSSPEFLELL